MSLRTTTTVLDAVWHAINGTMREPKQLRARCVAQMPEIAQAAGAAGWCGLLEVETILLALDFGVAEHTTGDVLRAFGVEPQWFYRRASSDRNVAGREGVTAVDLAWMLILLERMGLPTDPTPLCQALRPTFRDRTHLTEREIAAHWHEREQHRCEPMILDAIDLPQEGATLTHSCVTPSGYRAEWYEAVDCGASARIKIVAPKWRPSRAAA